MCKCEKCGKEESRYDRVEYIEELDQTLCGECERKFEDDLEDYEIRKRERLTEENEY